MSSMKDIVSKNDTELATYVTEKRVAIRKFRFAVAGSRTRNVRQVRKDKKDVARSLTELNRRTRSNKEAK